MKKISIVYLLLSIIFPVLSHAFTIHDSVSKDSEKNDISSTYTSVSAGNKITTNWEMVPIGTIIVWSTKEDPSDAEKWLECDGRNIDKAKYPILWKMFDDHKTPDYTKRFLRAGGINDLGRVADDSISSHTVSIATHTHDFSLKAGGSVTTLKADGETYVPEIKGGLSNNQEQCGETAESYPCNCVEEHMALEVCGKEIKRVCRKGIPCRNEIVDKYCEVLIPSTCETCTRYVPKYCNVKALYKLAVKTSQLEDGEISGTINKTEAITGIYYGADETAPKHIYVRYLIRALK